MAEIAFKSGDLVRRKGDDRVIRLDSVNPDPHYDPEEENFADAYYEPGYHYVEILRPEEIELVSQADADALYRMPTLDEVASQVSSSLHSGWEEAIKVSESEPDGPGVIQAFGRTPAGLPVAFKVTVSDIERYDD